MRSETEFAREMHPSDPSALDLFTRTDLSKRLTSTFYALETSLPRYIIRNKELTCFISLHCSLFFLSWHAAISVQLQILNEL